MTQDNRKRLSIITKIPKIRSKITGQSVGFIDRLKRLSKRDIALICAGIGILILAPVAEHFMMRPSADKLLTPGFGSRTGIGAAGELYEPGAGGFAPGTGGTEGDVITPLSARDPSSLIIPPDGAVKPPVPPSMGLRDAVRGAAKSAVSKAVRSAGAPVPIPKLQGSLRGLGMAGGVSTSGGLSGKGILQQADGAPSKAAPRSSLGPVPMADYRGVSHRTKSADGGAFEQLKAGAGSAASHMNEPGAFGALDRTAAESVEVGAGTGGGGPGEGEKFSKPSDSSIQGRHGQGGETLAQKLARMRAEKEMEMEFEKRKFWEMEVPQMVVKSVIDNILTAGFITPFGEKVKKTLFGSTSPWFVCWGYPPGHSPEDAPDMPDDKRCYPRDERPPLHYSHDKDEIAGMMEKKMCPCATSMVFESPTSPGGGADTPAQPQVPPTQAALEDVVGSDSATEVRKNFDDNVAKAKSALEKGEPSSIKKAYKLLKGAVVSAEAIIKQVNVGINVVENSMKPLPPAIVELKTLSDGKKKQVDATLAKLKEVEPGKKLATEFIRKQKDNVQGAYEGLKRIDNEAEFREETKAMNDVCRKPPKPNTPCLNAAIAPAAIHWGCDDAARKIGGAKGVLEEKNGHIAKAGSLTGSLDTGLTGAKRSRDLLVQQISDANKRLQREPGSDGFCEDEVYEAYTILTGEETFEQRKQQLLQALKPPPADIRDAPGDRPINVSGFRPDLMELFGNKEQVEPEKNYSDAFINKPESGVAEPEGYFSLKRMTVRIDVISRNMVLIKTNLVMETDGFLDLANKSIELARDAGTSLMEAVPDGPVTSTVTSISPTPGEEPAGQTDK